MIGRLPPSHMTATCLIVEPFYGGSHKQLADLIVSRLGIGCTTLVTLPAKKWHWKMRTASLTLAQQIPRQHSFKVLFSSSVLNLAELVGLRPDLAPLHKVLYFHENQLHYPVREEKARDVQFGLTQIASCLAADKIVFNSDFNRTSFLQSVDPFVNKIPDSKPSHLSAEIASKSSTLYFPLEFRQPIPQATTEDPERPLHIVWNHRWEFDKNPDEFLKAVTELHEGGFNFRLSVLGEQFTDVPDIFEKTRVSLAESHKVLNWGYLPSKEDYFRVLSEADVVVSTAIHEFFGVSVLEGISQGCIPLCPNRLVYPEFIPKQYLYNTYSQLLKRLKDYCARPKRLRAQMPPAVDYERFSWRSLSHEYMSMLTEVAEAQ